MPIAELINVAKRYGTVEALKDVDLRVERGELIALLGPNGAGKTTAVNLLLGQRRPDQGTARLFGRNPTESGARTLIGVTPQQTAFPQNLKVREVVDLVQAHYPDTPSGKHLLGRFGLAELESRSAGGLSGGQQRRLALALAFAGNPQAVFLDEPTTGVDVEARHNLWTGIHSFVDAGGTVLLTTHYLEEAEALASRIVVIHNGSIIADGSVGEITASVGLSQVPPASTNEWMPVHRLWRASTSTPVVGSSKKTAWGFPAKANANASLRCWPPLRPPAERPSRSARPNRPNRCLPDGVSG